MLDQATKFMEEALAKVANELHEIIIKETQILIKDWNRQLPKYEFQFGGYDLGRFRYKIKGTENWEILNHYRPDDYQGKFRNICLEAEKFIDAWCNLDTRFSALSFGWVGAEGEI